MNFAPSLALHKVLTLSAAQMDLTPAGVDRDVRQILADLDGAPQAERETLLRATLTAWITQIEPGCLWDEAHAGMVRAWRSLTANGAPNCLDPESGEVIGWTELWADGASDFQYFPAALIVDLVAADQASGALAASGPRALQRLRDRSGEAPRSPEVEAHLRHLETTLEQAILGAQIADGPTGPRLRL